MQNITIANQSYSVADITARFNDAQTNPAVHGVTLASDIANMLATSITTFANIVQATPVVLAAKNKDRNIMKLSTLNAMLSSSLATYTNAVKNSARKQGSDQEKVDNFKAKKAAYTRDADCAALATSDKSGMAMIVYLTYPNPRASGQRYFIDADTNEIMSTEDVAALMRPADAKRLLDPPTVTHNKTHDIEHTVSVRSVYLHNIFRVVANKQTATNF
jgi:hypothetical protein